MHPFSFENAIFFLADTPSTNTYPMKTVTENALQSGIFLKTPFSRFRVDGGNRNFLKTMTYQYWIQATARKRMYVSPLHQAAKKYTRMPKARVKLLH